MSANNKFYLSLMFGISQGLITLAVTAHAQTPDPTSYGITSGRLVASSAAVAGLIGVVIGLLSLFRPAGRLGAASGSLGAFVTLGAGLIAAVVGGVKAITTSGIGTGGGLAGAIVAIVLGLIAILLGGLALARSRRTA
jgi:hypothetical protein